MRRGFPSGSNGLLTFLLLWLGPTAFIFFVALDSHSKKPNAVDGNQVMSGPVFCALLLLGAAVFFIGFKWIRKLIAQSSDILWVR